LFVAEKRSEEEGERFRERRSPSSFRSLAGKFSWWGTFCFGLLILLTLGFGGVSGSGGDESFSGASGLVVGIGRVLLLSALLFLFVQRSEIVPLVARQSLTQKVVFAWLGLMIVVMLQGFLLHAREFSHPLLGTWDGVGDWGAWRGSVLELLVFLSSFLMMRVALERVSTDYLLRGLALIAAVTMTIALTHWFYDNGRLFWILEPDNVFVSERMRWPFVNPNHLGAFLLLLAFPLGGWTLALLSRVRHAFQDHRHRGVRFSQALSQDPELQLLTAKSLLLAFGVLVTVLGIAGTLSRGCWFGASFSLVFFSLGARKLFKAESRVVTRSVRKKNGRSVQVLEVHSGGSSVRVSGSHPKKLRLRTRMLWTSILTAPFLLFFALLNERGSELVTERIGYASRQSSSDVRWQMYQDSLELFAEAPLLGIGLGQWRSEYPRVMTRGLFDADGVYLHSDPYQWLLELGILGVLPGIVLFVLLVRAVISTLPRASTEVSLVLLGLGCGLLGALSASMIDFPFRLGAIGMLFSFLLAGVVKILDLHRPR
jgi:hypothetical protein